MRTAQNIKRELDTTIAKGKTAIAAGAPEAQQDALIQAAEALATEYKTARRDEAVKSLGLMTSTTDGPDLADKLLAAGFDRISKPKVTVAQSHALGVRLKTGSVDGGVDGTEIVDEYVSPLLGLDTRYLYPNLRSQGVNIDETGVRSYRQKSRTFASTSDMIRAIDATTAKPETDTTSEVVHEALKQIAHVETGTPNVLLANPSFRSWVNSDMTLGYRRAVDAHVVDELQGASIPSGGGGDNIFEEILYAQETVRAAGYSPNLVALSPGDGLALELLKVDSTGFYAFAQQPPTVVITSSLEDGEGFVADTSALGILFLSPFTVQVFEEEAGKTNSSTVRAESNGLFLVQREDAAATLAAS